jgi:hypothetical protein
MNRATPPEATASPSAKPDSASLTVGLWSVRCALVLLDLTPLPSRPFLDVGALPYLAHLQDDLRLREAVAADQLLNTLAAHAEHATDLCRPNEMMHSQMILVT